MYVVASTEYFVASAVDDDSWRRTFLQKCLLTTGYRILLFFFLIGIDEERIVISDL